MQAILRNISGKVQEAASVAHDPPRKIAPGDVVMVDLRQAKVYLSTGKWELALRNDALERALGLKPPKIEELNTRDAPTYKEKEKIKPFDKGLKK